ncbi:hypothetical protein [Simiduia aestuariiviva]|uniref:Uncharacterized protein n=1 Tax=Simiduia aestuariiviva TaxID=1510459 RepID=A0A839UQP6_9GAMM|nr:hypothetical protein [Simiduia aestuariiviva]MBB3170162.1 hypothetical protein [Simiduia aestuariiviva]
MIRFHLEVCTTQTQLYTVKLEASSEAQARAKALAHKGEWISHYPPDLEEAIIVTIREV